MKPTTILHVSHGPAQPASPLLLKRLALILALHSGWFTVGAHAQAAFEVGGAGVIGDSVLNVVGGTAELPVVGDRWKTAGGLAPSGEFIASTLISPAFAVPTSGDVTLTFTHRYDFEFGWDGGAVLVSVNGNPAVHLDGAAFTSNGYVGSTTDNNSAAWAGGENVFYGQSTGYGAPAFITSVANLGTLNAGDTVSIHFRGEWEEANTNGPPAWEISTIKLTDATTTDIVDLDFIADGPSGFTVSDIGTVTGPWTNNIASVLRFELDATAKTADRLVPESAPAVIDITGATIHAVVLTGELEIGDSYSLFDLSGGSTLTGTFAAVTLPPNTTWDTSNLETNGTITVTDLEFKNGTWITDADGNWTDPANWLDGTIANGPGKNAFLTAELTEATRIVSLNGEDRTIGHIVFTDGETSSNNLTIRDNTLTLQTNSGTPTVHVTQSGRTLAISSATAASQGILKTGPGTFQLGSTLGNNPGLTGAIRVDAGTLFMSNPSNVASVATIILNSGGFRVSPGANVSTNRPFEITENGGRLSKGSTHSLTFSGAFTITGSGDRTLTLENNGSSNGVGQLNTVLSDPAEGALSIRKTGNLIWVLNAANTYSGNTTIRAGTLRMSNANALQNSYIDTPAPSPTPATPPSMPARSAWRPSIPATSRPPSPSPTPTRRWTWPSSAPTPWTSCSSAPPSGPPASTVRSVRPPR